MINLINNYLFVVLPCSWYCILHKKQFGNSEICSFVMKYKAWILLAVYFLTASPLGMQEKIPATFLAYFTLILPSAHLSQLIWKAVIHIH